MQCKAESDQSADRVESVGSTSEPELPVEEELEWVKPSPHGILLPELEKCLKILGNVVHLQVKDLKKQINEVGKFQ
jgi:hypothetical protein